MTFKQLFWFFINMRSITNNVLLNKWNTTKLSQQRTNIFKSQPLLWQTFIQQFTSCWNSIESNKVL